MFPSNNAPIAARSDYEVFSLSRMKFYLHWILILLVCDGLYTVAIDYGRPLPEYNPSTVQNGWLNGATVFHPDAYDYASRPYSMLLRGISPLKPNFYHNPSLTIEINLLVSWLSNATSVYHGPFDPHAPLPNGSKLNCEVGEPPNPVCLRQISPFSVYVVARYLSAMMSLLALSVVYKGGRLIFTRQVGLLTALLVGLCPMVVQIAHYENPGATTLAVSSAALFISLLLMKRQSSSYKMYFGAGLLVGLSTAARYNAGVVSVVFLLACVLKWRGNQQIVPVIIGMVAVPFGFLVGTPGAIFEFRVFFNDVRYILSWYSSLGGGPGWTTASGFQSAFDNWRYLFLIVLGPLVGVAGIWGLFKLLKHYRAKDAAFWMGVALLTYILAYSLFALTSKRLNANLLIPMITPVALLAAYGWVGLPACVPRTPLVNIGLAVVLTAWPAFLAVYFAGMLSKPDNRMMAQEWIYRHIPQNTPIHLLGSYNVPVDPLVYPTTQTFGAQASLSDPLWNVPIIVYSDAYPHIVLRDPSLTENPADVENTKTVIQRLRSQWIELAHFPRLHWPGEDIPPDDVSLWHQMEIVVYCNPENCPVKPG